MTITFRPALRENVSLLLGLAGGTGSGKSFSAMRLASGISPNKPFAVIDSENRRALHYADQFKFDHAELHAPFRPDAYADAIVAADAAGYSVIVVDQMSFEHAGEGGLLDWQEEELQRMAGDDYKKREACKMSSWIKPKRSHKVMMQRLLQVKAHLILCFRAEAKIEMVKDEHGKWIVQPKKSLVGIEGWIPIAEKTLPYELTASFLLTADAPGVPKPIKLQSQHKPLFPLDKPITEESGRAIAEWAAGGTKAAANETKAPPGETTAYITPDQVATLETLCQDNGIELGRLKAKVGVERLAQIPAGAFDRAQTWIRNASAAKTGATT
jgi:hypothetical protein